MRHAKRFAPLVLAVAALAADDLAAAPLKLLLLDDMSCAGWAKTSSDPDAQAAYVHWVRGFLSGHNYANQSAQVAVVSSGTIGQFVDRHCRSNPQSDVAEAAMRMSDQYSGRNAPIRK